VEKIVDVRQNFKEIEYGVVPMLDYELETYFKPLYDGVDVDELPNEVKTYHYYYN